jgi:Spy/CpxP family protein refolding chaperone
MTRDMKILTTAGAIAAATVIGCFAYIAHAGTTEATPARGRIAERLVALGVTDQQKAEVKTVLRKHQPTVQPLVKQLVTERRALRNTIRAETIDESAVRAEAAKVASLEADLAMQRAHLSHDIRAVLTPDQIQKLKDMQVDFDVRIDGFLHRVAKRIAED